MSASPSTETKNCTTTTAVILLIVPLQMWSTIDQSPVTIRHLTQLSEGKALRMPMKSLRSFHSMARESHFQG